MNVPGTDPWISIPGGGYVITDEHVEVSQGTWRRLLMTANVCVQEYILILLLYFSSTRVI